MHRNIIYMCVFVCVCVCVMHRTNGYLLRTLDMSAEASRCLKMTLDFIWHLYGFFINILQFCKETFPLQYSPTTPRTEQACSGGFLECGLRRCG